MKFLYFSVTVFEFLCDFFWISCWNVQADQEECKHCNAWLLFVWDQKHKLIRISNPSIYKVEINWWNLRKGNNLTNYDSVVFELHSQYLKQSVTFLKILIRMNVRIYLYQQNYTNEYPNIFILIFLTRTNVRISIHIENRTNIRIYSNIRLGFTL